MEREEMDRLIEAHLQAESAGDAQAWAAVYTDDAELDVVGTAAGPLYGHDEARRFFAQFRNELRSAEVIPLRAYYGEDFCVTEHEWRGSVPGSVVGMAGNGARTVLRMLHIFEFRDGRISRENVWFDVTAMLRQLAHDRASAVATS